MVKKPPANAGDLGWIPELGGSPGGERGNPLQYSCLENPMDSRAWQGIVHRVAKSWAQLKQHSTCHKNLEMKDGMGPTGLPSLRIKERKNRSRINNLFMGINYHCSFKV